MTTYPNGAEGGEVYRTGAVQSEQLAEPGASGEAAQAPTCPAQAPQCATGQPYQQQGPYAQPASAQYGYMPNQGFVPQAYDAGNQPVQQPQQQMVHSAGQGAQQQGYQGYPQCQQAQGGAAETYLRTENENALTLVAFIFAVISTVSVGWLLVPLAWMIPMTIRCWGIYKGTKPITTAFAVCALIFLNLVSGILLLLCERDR